MNLDIDEVTLILSGVEILEDLEMRTINDIAQQVTVAEFSAQELLVKQGQRGDRMFIIFNGKVEVCFAESTSSSTDRIILNKGAVKYKYRKYKSHIFILQAVKYHPIISHLS